MVAVRVAVVSGLVVLARCRRGSIGGSRGVDVHVCRTRRALISRGHFVECTRRRRAVASGPQSETDLRSVFSTHIPVCARNRRHRVAVAAQFGSDWLMASDPLNAVPAKLLACAQNILRALFLEAAEVAMRTRAHVA